MEALFWGRRPGAWMVAALLLAGCALWQAGEEPETYDVVITGGRLVDGAGNPWVYGDLGIRGEEITYIGPRGALSEADAREHIDAEGLVVAPGFMDVLSHSDEAFVEGDPRVVSKVTQGITTEIVGEGTSYAPVNRRMLEHQELDEEEIEERLERFSGPRGFDRWLSHMEERGPSVNVGAIVGATTLRRYVMDEENRAPTPAELDTMQALTRRAMEDGALGVGSSLIYTPATNADTEELAALAEVAAAYGGLYSTHVRSEGDRLMEGLEEAIEIGRRSGGPVEIHHLKAAGERNWDKATESFELIEQARREGVDVQANMYPYPMAGTGLASCLPPSVPSDELTDVLSDEDQRTEIREEMLNPGGEWENLCELATAEGVIVLGLSEEHNERWVGRSLQEIADERDQHWVEALMDLVAEEGWVASIFELMSEENVLRTMEQPWIKFGTDAGGVDPEEATALVHPRTYGTFPRILGRYVREEAALPLEEAIRKMTSAVASRYAIPDRGLLKEGMKADVVVFDSATATDHATFEAPHQLSEGIEHVFVNGTAVLREGEHTGAGPGKTVRGPGYRLEEGAEGPRMSSEVR